MRAFNPFTGELYLEGLQVSRYTREQFCLMEGRHVHPSTLYPGGVGTETSQITIIGNIIYDCDQAVDAKQGNFYTMINNTIVHQSHLGGVDTDGAVVILADTGTAPMT